MGQKGNKGRNVIILIEITNNKGIKYQNTESKVSTVKREVYQNGSVLQEKRKCPT